MPWRQHLRHGFIRLRRDGLPWLAATIFNRLFPARPAEAQRAFAVVENLSGLEIGGPSQVFSRRGIIPLYSRVAHLDNVNFAAQTSWESELRDGGNFRFDRNRPAGRQFLREATALTGLADQSYDFILSSHCLEHVANPLAALHEWRRVVRPEGYLVLILPDPERTFDCARPITTLAHLQSDFRADVAEDDLTHLNEILALHDLGRDPHAGSREEFRARAGRNAENRCLHHHVFDLALMRAALEHSGWQVHAAERVRPMHLLAFAQKSASGQRLRAK